MCSNYIYQILIEIDQSSVDLIMI